MEGAVLPLAWACVSPKVCSMIYRCLFALFCLVGASGSFAQALRVELEFEQETFLPREPLYAVVRVINNSGRTLVLGNDDEWLSFSIESVDGAFVRNKKPAEVKKEFTLPSSSRATEMINLAEAFDLSKIGRYVVRASVRMPEWRETFTSKDVPFGVAAGVKLWESTFGVPAEQAQGRPELRKFQLLSANHLRQLSLYVRVTGESEEDTFTLYPIGSLHGFSKPEPQVDRWSNLHVLYQDGARSFRYNLITPDGLLLARQSWDITEGSRPTLKVDEEGHIAIFGGVRRITPNDLPPPDLLTDNSDTAPEKIAADKPLDVKKVGK